MQQGILVTAYKKPDWLQRMLNRFGPNVSFFVHVDRKSSAEDQDRYRQLTHAHENLVFVSNQYEVNWGGFNHLKAILLLVQKAVESGIGYCHLITGQDYPVKSATYFETQLDGRQNFIEFFPLPTSNWKDGGLDRLIYYHFHDIFDPKTRLGKVPLKLLAGIQGVLHMKRPLPDNVRFYGGSTYWSLNRVCLEYVLDYIRRDPSFLARFRYTFCAEEVFFQTVLLNSPLRETLINDNRRYICWHTRNGSAPAILDASDFDSIITSKALFARKMAYPESQDLVDRIDKMVHSVISSGGAGRRDGEHD